MKKSYFLLGCAMSLGMAAQAALPAAFDVRGNYAMDRNTPTANVGVRSFTGVGDDKGVTFFGSTFYDGTGVPSSVTFNTNSLRDINRLDVVKEDDDYSLWRVQAGAKAGNGTYYCHFVKVYSLTDTYGGWGRIDMNTGKVYIDYVAASSNGGYDVYYNYNTGNGSRFPNVYRILDMTWNAANNKMYAIAMDKDVNNLNTLFGTVDITSGNFTPIASLDGLFSALACDLDGNFYGAYCDGTNADYVEPQIKGIQIVKIDVNNLVDEGDEYPYAYHDKVVDLMYDGGVFRSYGGFGTLVPDDTTGELYYFINRLTDDWQVTRTSVAYRINLYDDTAECLGTIGWSNDIFVGGVIEMRESAADRNAPAQVKNLKAAFAADGASNVTFTWNNPVSTWNLKDLQSLKEMRISVDTPENVKATVPASLDTESYTYTLTGVEPGAHNFYVTAVDGQNRVGVPTPAEMWAGHDVPGLPIEVTLTNATEDETPIAHITWNTPAEGKNGGWFDAENIKYNIVRMPDNTVVATNHSGLSFDDTTINEMASYYYLVSGVTADGEGPAAESNHVLIGNAISTPYYTPLLNQNDAEMWDVFDGPSGYSLGNCYENWDSGVECPWRGVKLDFPGSRDVDMYATSPKIFMEKGKTYYVEMQVNFHHRYEPTYRPNQYHDYELCIGTERTAEAMQKNVFLRVDRFKSTVEDQKEMISGYVVCPETGGYHVAYHECTTNPGEDIVSVQSLLVEECYDTDLKPLSISGTPAPAVGKKSVYAVDVLNHGNQRVRNYTVKVVRAYADMTIGLGANTITTFLAPHETRTVYVEVTPDIAGEYEIFAEVEVDGDANTENNLLVSAPMVVDARDLGYEPLNEEIVMGTLDYETRQPFSFADSNSANQAIYLMGTDMQWTPVINENGEAQTPTITDIAYEFEINDEYAKDFNGVTNMPVRIYLSQATTKYYRSATKVLPVGDQTKVFDGVVSFKGGNGLLILHFDQPFEIDLTKNLIVTAVKGDGGNISHEWAIRWRNNDIGENEQKRAAMYWGKSGSTFDANPSILPSTSPILQPRLPRVFFAVTGLEGMDGVENIVESAVAEDGNVRLSDIINPVVYVYDLAGRLVDSFVPQGDSLDLNVEPGVYVVNVAGDNKTLSTKIKVGL